MKSKFCKKLDESLKDENVAPKNYAMLSSYTNKQSIKNKLKEISNQEKNHFQILKGIQKEEC